MYKYLISVSYDGSYFYGWAKQNDFFTVQGFIEDKISSIFSCKVSVLASSRTDKGVHAIDQKFTFFLNSISLDSLRMKKILDKCLGSLIQVNGVSVVNKSFDLKKNITLKEYRYFMILKNYSVFHKKYYFDASGQVIDVKLLQETLNLFKGSHDFFNFSYIREKDKLKRNTLREIKEINIEKFDSSKLCVKFFSKGFLRYQIRAILGECIDKHKKTNGILDLLNMLTCNQKMKYSKIAPPSALYLWKVFLKSEN